MNEFALKVAEILEVQPEELSPETDFRNEVGDFDSLRGFALLCMFEDDYGAVVTVDEFISCQTVGDLFEKVNTRSHG